LRTLLHTHGVRRGKCRPIRCATPPLQRLKWLIRVAGAMMPFNITREGS
jgi:hypothetical protein